MLQLAFLTSPTEGKRAMMCGLYRSHIAHHRIASSHRAQKKVKSVCDSGAPTVECHLATVQFPRSGSTLRSECGSVDVSSNTASNRGSSGIFAQQSLHFAETWPRLSQVQCVVCCSLICEASRSHICSSPLEQRRLLVCQGSSQHSANP